MHILFATAPDFPALTADDHLAAAAFAERGITVEPVIWSRSEPESARDVDAVVIRSCWDYHLHEREFVAWLTRVERLGIAVINPPALVRWNLHKRYIAELQKRDVAVVPTILVERNDPRSLRDHIDASGWTDAVVKPAVSLSAYQTWRVAARGAEQHEDRFTLLRSTGDVLIQRFIGEVTSDGEWSLMFFGTQFSHAVRKRPKPGDFRVQDEHGGSAVIAEPSQKLIDDALLVVRALPHTPVYTRVDGVVVNDAFLLMEAECIDPVLFFAGHPPAADLFADEVLRYLAARVDTIAGR